MHPRLVCLLLLAASLSVTKAQVVNTAMMDTVETTFIGHVGLGGYVDSYFAYNFNRPAGGVMPYFVSNSKSNEATVNLAYIDVRYRSSHLRTRFVPGFGTYMDANYRSEPGSLKNMVEASVGVLLFPKKKIWIDAGVLGSPYTNESAISRDHLMYTRSFAPENVPYYVTGVRMTLPLNEKFNLFVYLINGWQVIQDNNNGKSIGTHLEYRPNKYHLFNWTTYIGDERSVPNPEFRTRYFNDFYWIYKGPGRFSATSDFYVGFQERTGGASTKSWWQANFIGSYTINQKLSVSGRIEHFNDPGGVNQTPITGASGFVVSSAGACLNVKLHSLGLFRFEARQFFAEKNIYLDSDSRPINTSLLLVSSLTAWF